MTIATLDTTVKPFLKWAGGKQSLLHCYRRHFPKPGTFGDYYEPFLGSGAVFLALYAEYFDACYQHFNGENAAFLSDLSGPLVNVWKSMQLDSERLQGQLAAMRWGANYRSVYDQNRSRFNQLEGMSAAYFIWLNRCGFNGLYRENLKGEFNVPCGKYKNPQPPIEQITKVAPLLEGIHIQQSPYQWMLEQVRPGDFVYFDPPYYPVSKNSFIGYGAQKFGAEEQSELAEHFYELSEQGVKIALSNSDCDWVREAYSDYRIIKVPRSGRISSKGNERRPVIELLILNW